MTEEIKDITIDQLAGMMNNSFEDLKKTIGGVKIELTDKIDGLRNEVIPRLDKVEMRLNGIDNRLERIEEVMIRDDRKRIDRLEDKLMKVQVILKTQL
jgi:hypothetical protein